MPILKNLVNPVHLFFYLFLYHFKRGSGCVVLHQVFEFALHRAAPVQFLVLIVALGQLPGDLRARQFHTEVKSMRRIIFQIEQGKQRKRIRGDVQSVAVIDVNALFADLNSVARVLDGARQFGDFF